jgi:glycosyltransferase involved in cell wall biosynthesis
MAYTVETEEPTVSLLTITQYSRRECLANLSMLIHRQIYKNIIEWVIVEGTPDKEDSMKNAEIISQMKSDIPINFVSWRAGQQLSDLRNAGNEVCKGDIIVCLDDDDYYPPTRVSHAVYRLQNSEALIAGCSQAYIYFYQSAQFFQFKRLFGNGHSTNNCMAYKRAYLENHRHQSGLDKAEESSFTDEFTEPMEQLDPAKTIVISGHGTNTVDKSLLSPNIMRELVSSSIIDYIPLPILLKMEKMFE